MPPNMKSTGAFDASISMIAAELLPTEAPAPAPAPAPVVVADKKQLEKRMKAILKEKGNKSCSECRSHKPKWMSLLAAPIDQDHCMLGVLVCHTCREYHLALGQDLCQLKSLKEPETWTERDIVTLEHSGNSAVNAIYQSALEGNHTDKHIGSLASAAFVRSKYQDCQYFTEEAYHRQMALRAAGKDTTDRPPTPTTEDKVRRALGKQGSIRNLTGLTNLQSSIRSLAGINQGSIRNLGKEGSMRMLFAKNNCNSIQKLDDNNNNNASTIKNNNNQGSSSMMFASSANLSSSWVSHHPDGDNNNASKNNSSLNRSFELLEQNHSNPDLQQPQELPVLSLKERRQQRRTRSRRSMLVDTDAQAGSSNNQDSGINLSDGDSEPEETFHRSAPRLTMMRKSGSNRDLMRKSGSHRDLMRKSGSYTDLLHPGGRNRAMNRSSSQVDLFNRTNSSSNRRLAASKALSQKDLMGCPSTRVVPPIMKKSLSQKDLIGGRSSNSRVPMKKSLSQMDLMGSPSTSRPKYRRATSKQRLVLAKEESFRKGLPPKSKSQPHRRNTRSDSSRMLVERNNKGTSTTETGWSRPNRAARKTSSRDSAQQPQSETNHGRKKEMRRSRSGSEEEGDRGKTNRRATQPSNNNSRRSLSPDGSPPPKTNKHRGHHPKSSSKAPRSLSPMERRKEQKPRRSSLAMLTLTAPSGHDDQSFGATASSSMFPERTTVKKPNRRTLLESQSDEDGLMRTMKMNHKPHATLSADAAIEGVRRSDKPRRRTKRGSGRDVVEVTKAKRSSSKRSQPVKALSASSGLDFRQDWEKEVSLESTKKASLSDSDPLVLNWEGSDDESDGNEGTQDCQLRDSLDATDADDAV